MESRQEEDLNNRQEDDGGQSDEGKNSDDGDYYKMAFDYKLSCTF